MRPDLLAAAQGVQAAVAPTRPVGERGTISNALGMSMPGWDSFALVDDLEHVPALQWPTSVQTYRAMQTDSQVAALRQAIRLPTHRYLIEIDPGDTDPVAADLLATDLDLPLVGSAGGRRPGRRRGRFSSRKHLDRTLDGLDYGHAVFETVGEIDAAGDWRLRDLAPRPAWTIDQWFVDQAGHLVRVEQQHQSPPIVLDADRLAVWSWQGDAGDPRGKSMLRPLYRNWVVKDRLIRIDAVSHERTGMGIPVGTVGDGDAVGARVELERLLAGLAAGEDTNLVLPYGADVRLMGVSGTVPDKITSLRWHDEQMAKAMLAMLIELGSTSTGSRALGDNFADLLGMFHDAVMDWYCDGLTEQVCEPWIDRNRGTDAPAPRVVWRRADDAKTTVSYQYDLDYGVMTIDERRAQLGLAPLPDGAGLEIAVPSTQRDPASGEPVGLPVSASSDPAATVGPGGRKVCRVSTPLLAAAAALPDRKLHRAPYDQEIRAAVDYNAMDAEFNASRDAVSKALLALRGEVADHAVEEIAAMDTVNNATLADDLAPLLDEFGKTLPTGKLAGLLKAAADAGAAQVAAEAKRQGADLTVDQPDYSDAAELEASGMVGRVGRQVADSAGTAARVAVPADASPADIAEAAATQIANLTTALVDRAAAGASARAQLAGRVAVLDGAPIREIYASELLDANTCGPCSAVDGTQYESLEDAMSDYPTGGFLGCEGQEACRGTLVAIFDTEQEAVT
jgi:hypothetical protein